MNSTVTFHAGYDWRYWGLVRQLVSRVIASSPVRQMDGMHYFLVVFRPSKGGSVAEWL